MNYMMKFRGIPKAKTMPRIAAVATSKTAIDLNAIFILSPCTGIIRLIVLSIQAFFSNNFKIA